MYIHTHRPQTNTMRRWRRSPPASCSAPRSAISASLRERERESVCVCVRACACACVCACVCVCVCVFGVYGVCIHAHTRRCAATTRRNETGLFPCKRSQIYVPIIISAMKQVSFHIKGLKYTYLISYKYTYLMSYK